MNNMNKKDEITFSILLREGIKGIICRYYSTHNFTRNITSICSKNFSRIFSFFYLCYEQRAIYCNNRS